MFTKFSQSLSTRLILVFVLAGIILAGAVLATVYHGFAAQWRSNMRPHVRQYLEYVNQDLGHPPDTRRASELTARLPIDIYITGPDLNYSSSGKPIDTDRLELRMPQHHRNDLKKPANIPESDNRRNKDHRLAPDQQLRLADLDDRTFLVNTVDEYQIVYELRHRHRNRDRNRLIPWFLLIPLGLIAGLYWLINRMLKPVHQIKAGVERMGQGELSHRVSVKTKNDLGALAGSINIMASDIENMLDAKRQLLLGASHELRTPLTRVRVALGLMEASPYRDSVEDDIDEMEHLIANLLETERIKDGHAALTREPVLLQSLVRQTLTDIQAEDIVVQMDDPALPLMLDNARIELLLRNLIGNARTHAHNPEKPAELSITHQTDSVTISMRDYGAGIPENLIAKVTQPFYRADSSRTPQQGQGGSGLGLYLIKLIAEAHGGNLTIDSVTAATHGELSGTTFTVNLPV